MKVTANQLRQIIKEEKKKIISEAESKRTSELKQFSASRSGRKVESAGKKITGAARAIYEVHEDQTGYMRESLGKLSEFLGKIGNTLGNLSMIEEGKSINEGLPTIQEYKEVQKMLERLQKV